MRRLLLGCLVLSFSLPLVALWNPKMRSFQEMATEQRRVVSAYCRLDFLGARLSPEGWERIRNLLTFRENPDFHSFYVVSRYQYIETTTPTAEVEVRYVVIGHYEEGAGYVPMPLMRSVTFELHDRNGELRISYIDPPTPFVSRAATIDWLKSRLEREKDPANRAQMEASIKALEAQNTGASAPK